MAYYCPICGEEVTIDADGDFYCESCDAYYDSADSDSDEAGCIACGNPAYPKCKSSCPLFDD